MSVTMFIFFGFLALKLSNIINWSWWWVCSPLWVPFAIALPFMILCAMFKK